MSVTLMLIPSAVSAAIAGRPSGVAGTLTSQVGTRHRAVEPPRLGDRAFRVVPPTGGLTSMLTRPSRVRGPCSQTARGQVARHLDVLDRQSFEQRRSLRVRSRSAPRSLRRSRLRAIACWKMVGFESRPPRPIHITGRSELAPGPE